MRARTVARPSRSSRASVVRELERDVLDGCLQACRALGILAERRNVGQVEIGGRTVRFGRKGAADITGTIPRGPHRGKRLELEVKRPGARPRPEQLERLAEVREAGGIAFWCDDAQDCFRVLGRILDKGAWIELDESGSQWAVWAEPDPENPGPRPAA